MIRPHIEMLLGTRIPAGLRGSEEMGIFIATYCVALADLPTFAVLEACAAALRGKVGSSKQFAPTPAELHEASERYLAWVIREKRLIERVLNAKPLLPISDEEREARKKRIRQIANSAIRDMNR